MLVFYLTKYTQLGKPWKRHIGCTSENFVTFRCALAPRIRPLKKDVCNSVALLKKHWLAWGFPVEFVENWWLGLLKGITYTCQKLSKMLIEKRNFILICAEASFVWPVRSFYNSLVLQLWRNILIQRLPNSTSVGITKWFPTLSRVWEKHTTFSILGIINAILSSAAWLTLAPSLMAVSKEFALTP